MEVYRLISIVLGTRPEIIKFSPVIRECMRVGQEFSIIHTGQHYSYNMDRVFFEQLKLPETDYNLEVGSGTHAEQTGKMLIGIERSLGKQKPQVVLVEGDTNTVLAGALAATKLGIKVGHVEAGLRSYDTQMPEETNRTLADHCSDLLFAPTPRSRDTLLREGIPKQKIFVTGNTIVDAVKQNIKIANKKRKNITQEKLALKLQTYFVVTLHRQENVDNPDRLRRIIKGLEKVQKDTGYPIVYPVHPRTKKNLEKLGLQLEEIKTIDPLDYLNFLWLESNARLVLTDSGGVQEETCTLNVPCVTLRDNTERPETLEVGSNILAGANPDKIVECVQIMLEKKRWWKNPFGDGKAGERIVHILKTERD
jgi:UDP-N-acetylglucosamine 2-epimerase (non-hydrolysing)